MAQNLRDGTLQLMISFLFAMVIFLVAFLYFEINLFVCLSSRERFFWGADTNVNVSKVKFKWILTYLLHCNLLLLMLLMCSSGGRGGRMGGRLCAQHVSRQLAAHQPTIQHLHATQRPARIQSHHCHYRTKQITTNN